MCKVHYHKEVYPDGRPNTWTNNELCSRSRHGQLCERTKEYRHPTEYISAHLSPRFQQDAYPPTPPRSNHSGSESERSSGKKRSSGLYSSGAKEINIERRPSSRRDKGERVVYADEPSLSRTPPRGSAGSYSNSPSPNASAERRRRRSSVVEPEHTRPSVKVEVINESPQRSKKTTSSNSSNSHSNPSPNPNGGSSIPQRRNSSRDSSEEARLRQRRLEDMFNRDEESQTRIHSRISRANDTISSRPAIPQQGPPPVTTSTATSKTPKYRRPSVVLDRPATDVLASKMNRMNIKDARAEEEKARRRAERLAQEERVQEEQDAQKKRLKNRMTLSGRRQSVSYTRPTGVFADSLYRQ